MGFVGAVKTCISKYAVFKGRASRSEFWWFILFCFLMQVLTTVFDGLVLGTVTSQPYMQITSAGGSDRELTGWHVYDDSYNPYIIVLLLLLPTLAASVRRLHDIGRSGFWMLVLIIPQIFGFILAALLTMARAPTSITNPLVGVVVLVIPIIGSLALLFWWVQPSMAGQNDYDAAPLPPHLRGEPDFR